MCPFPSVSISGFGHLDAVRRTLGVQLWVRASNEMLKEIPQTDHMAADSYA